MPCRAIPSSSALRVVFSSLLCIRVRYGATHMRVAGVFRLRPIVRSLNTFPDACRAFTTAKNHKKAQVCKSCVTRIILPIYSPSALFNCTQRASSSLLNLLNRAVETTGLVIPPFPQHHEDSHIATTVFFSFPTAGYPALGIGRSVDIRGATTQHEILKSLSQSKQLNTP